ncbi:hypothetical protein S7335_1966 [Synechococcus sp. PCC 7335]|nr:hypothetical protein S7335_1966 [Synechococcus sp. PCC 7335]
MCNEATGREITGGEIISSEIIGSETVGEDALADVVGSRKQHSENTKATKRQIIIGIGKRAAFSVQLSFERPRLPLLRFDGNLQSAHTISYCSMILDILSSAITSLSCPFA